MWFRVIRAARYLQVPPWELAQQPYGWLRMAEESQAAEAFAEEKRHTPGRHRRH